MSCTAATAGAVVYEYDGEARRVKTAGVATTIFVYNAAGELAAESESGAGRRHRMRCVWPSVFAV